MIFILSLKSIVHSPHSTHITFQISQNYTVFYTLHSTHITFHISQNYTVFYTLHSTHITFHIPRKYTVFYTPSSKIRINRKKLIIIILEYKTTGMHVNQTLEKRLKITS